MLGRITAMTLLIGGAISAPGAALAQSDAAVAAGVATAVIVGAAVATGALPVEHHAPLRQHIYSEPRRSHVYSDEIAVGRELRHGPYESYPVPERYGVRDHHYTIVNDRAVVYDRQSGRIVHVYD